MSAHLHTYVSRTHDDIEGRVGKVTNNVAGECDHGVVVDVAPSELTNLRGISLTAELNMEHEGYNICRNFENFEKNPLIKF